MEQKIKLLVDQWDEPIEKNQYLRHFAGDVFFASDAHRLIECGAAVPIVEPEIPSEDTHTHEGPTPPAPGGADSEPVTEPEDETDPVEEPVSPDRPKQTASEELWRKYAESIGIDTKELKTKQQLIAAVKKTEE